MKYEYGTSGFRFHHTIMRSIAFKIGQAVAILSCKYNKHYGIMITASHNPHHDNGVKLINSNGEMIDNNDEDFMTKFVNDLTMVKNTSHNFPVQNELLNVENIDIIDDNKWIWWYFGDEYIGTENNEIQCDKQETQPQITSINNKIKYIPTIYIGYDTRESSPDLYNLIVDGIKNVNSNSIINNYEYISTPGLHYALYKTKTGVLSYNDYLLSLIKLLNSSTRIICDCANGIGSKILQDVCNEQNMKPFTLINTETRKYNKLNNNCGSDFVVNTLTIPSNIRENNQLYASLDGDADRVVFYFLSDQNEFQLLNGDKISALIAYYIAKQVADVKNIAVIHTGYSNQAFIRYIRSLGIQTYCTATGVKNLHREALKHDISIYFETNGHGTVIFNKDYDTLTDLQHFFHPTIGDGIMDMIAILYILERLNISLENWNTLYEDNIYELFKLEVVNKNIFETTENQLRLTHPIELQDFVDQLCKENNTIAFIRPSGTENIVRVYIESKCNNKLIFVREKIKNFVGTHYMENSKNIFEMNGKKFAISYLSENDYDSNYFNLLQQLTSIDPEKITKNEFISFISNLSNKHIIKIIKDVNTQKIVGTITILIEDKIIHNFGKVGHIEDVVVDETMRGFGLGKILIDTAKNECKDCYKIILDCSSHNIKFYEKCGFEIKGNEMAIYL